MLSVLAVSVTLAVADIARAAPVTAGRSTVPSFLGCNGTRREVRPVYILVSCGDANFYVNKLKWSRWISTAAVGTGTAHQNDCRPFCAAGHFHAYPVMIRLSRPETCGSRERLFTRFTYVFSRSTPDGISRRHTISAPFYGRSCP